MKKFCNLVFTSVVLLILMSSCFSYKFTIGEGPQSGVIVKEKNNFWLGGLVTGKISSPEEMADGAENYEVTEVHTFVDQLISGVTFGIYTPTTTIVQK
ncbi:MAG: Bor family protein [Ekhidna sp.]|nr:Bor family protein [Ekhidna sp.]